MIRLCMSLGCLLLLLPQELEACKCKAYPADASESVITEYLDRMPIAFIGIARDVAAERVTSFEVLWSYKGVVTRRVTAVASDNCAYSFQPGQVYVVYSSGPTIHELSVSKCGRTGRFDERLADVILFSRRQSLVLKPDSAPRQR